MRNEKIFGREKEIKELDHLWESLEPEFLAIYGRRRVGKTYLIREYFSKKRTVYFEMIGQKDGGLKVQLENFIKIFSATFHNELPLKPPASWKEAFELLTQEIKKSSLPVVLFFDELPWLSTPKSKMLQALDYYWNRFWNQMPKVILVVCGSAASWMLDNLINAKGGLHNRLTKTILLRPYNLRETGQFLEERDIYLKPKQLLDVYLIFGGIPYYLRHIEKGKSPLQIVNKTCFQKDGLLYDEFDRLFQSLFENATDNLSIIKAIYKSRMGISRDELVRMTGISSGGTLNKRLKELETAGFIQSYIPYGNKIKNHFFRIIDEYCYFYLRWIYPFKAKGIEGGKEYWQTKGRTPAALAWMGYAFENICLKHIDQIQEALDLQSIACDIGNWRYLPQKKNEIGAQIDLLFDREDGVITLCEIKYSDKLFVVDKTQAKIMLNKIEAFQAHFPSKKQIHFAMITIDGLKSMAWSKEIVHNVITLKDLLKF